MHTFWYISATVKCCPVMQAQSMALTTQKAPRCIAWKWCSQTTCLLSWSGQGCLQGSCKMMTSAFLLLLGAQISEWNSWMLKNSSCSCYFYIIFLVLLSNTSFFLILHFWLRRLLLMKTWHFRKYVGPTLAHKLFSHVLETPANWIEIEICNAEMLTTCSKLQQNLYLSWLTSFLYKSGFVLELMQFSGSNALLVSQFSKAHFANFAPDCPSIQASTIWLKLQL